jgi:3-oxoacyl-[acyl-carrier protein] reductase
MIRYDFHGKVVLVTGSSRGIGAAILAKFAEAGATCALHYWDDPDGANKKDADALASKLGSAVRAFAADVRDAAQVEGLMQAVKAEFGGLDVLVNNAGVLKDRSLRKMTLDDWHAVIQTNLTGVFHCCKYAAEVLRDGGRVVSIASVAGLVGIHGQANYAAAKAGVIGMTRSLAKEFARRGITVNAVAPGVVQTPMLGEIKAELMTEYLRQIPVGRLAQPDDVANVVLFLASEETGYVTGQVIPVTGGWLV